MAIIETKKSKITPCLWFDMNAEEAVNFYTTVFKNSRITAVSRYGKGAPIPEGTVLTMSFEIEGSVFMALNGGPHFKFSEAVSFVVNCENQEEVDYFWTKLTEGGAESQCGWLKDKFGLSWQIVPSRLSELMSGGDAERSSRVMREFMKMKKLDINVLEQAYKG